MTDFHELPEAMMGEGTYLILRFNDETPLDNIKAFLEEIEPITKEVADKHDAHGEVHAFVGSLT